MTPGSSLDMLGVQFDAALRLTPFHSAQLRAGRAIRGTISRLALHLPRGTILNMIANALISGKFGYAAAIALPVRFTAEDPRDAAVDALQVIINDVARRLIGGTRSSRTRTDDLLTATGLPSLNHLTATALVVETWKAATGNVELNPLAALLRKASRTRFTRAGRADLLPPPTPIKTRTFIWTAHKVWNS